MGLGTPTAQPILVERRCEHAVDAADPLPITYTGEIYN
jgi:hypothetical protein